MTTNAVKKFPEKSLDYTIGIILSIASTTGIIMNITAFGYFKTMKARNNNNKFFKRLYMVISFTDILICTSYIPVIETTFSVDREGTLFKNQIFCEAWGVFWYTAYQISILMVSTLGISRFLVIKKTNYDLQPWIPYVIPSTVAVCCLLLLIVQLLKGIIYPIFYRELIHCSFLPFPSSRANSTDILSTRQILVHGIFSLVVYGLNTTSFIAVACSFVLSMIYLTKSRRAAKNIGSSQKYQREASKTVILVTLLYLCSSTLFFSIVFPYSIIDMIANPIIPEKSTISDLYESIVEMFGGNDFLNNYAFSIFYMLSTCLNSTMNPIVYYLRIRLFRDYVDKLKNRICKKFRSGLLMRISSIRGQAKLHPENVSGMIGSARRISCNSSQDPRGTAITNAIIYNQRGEKYEMTSILNTKAKGMEFLETVMLTSNATLSSREDFADQSISSIHQETDVELSSFLVVNYENPG